MMINVQAGCAHPLPHSRPQPPHAIRIPYLLTKGNKFLQNIRDVSVILHVLRCYDDTDIVHVEESIDPVRDMDIIETELILADLQSVEKRLGNLKKKMTFNTGDRELNQLKAILEKCFAALDQGKPLRSLNHTWGGDDVRVLKTLQLLTNKPLAYVLNVDEESAVTGNTHTKAVCDVIQQRLDEEYTAQHGDEADADAGAGADGAHRRLSADDVTVMTSAALEAEAAASFDTLEGQLEFLQLADVETTGLQNTIKLSAELLQLEHYYTLGPKEA